MLVLFKEFFSNQLSGLLLGRPDSIEKPFGSKKTFLIQKPFLIQRCFGKVFWRERAGRPEAGRRGQIHPLFGAKTL